MTIYDKFVEELCLFACSVIDHVSSCNRFKDRGGGIKLSLVMSIGFIVWMEEGEFAEDIVKGKKFN